MISKVSCQSCIKEHLLVILLFVILTLVLTYPIIAHVTTHTAGSGDDDLIFQWSIWHISETLKGGGGISDIYHSNLLFYPHGASLEFRSFTLTNTLFLALPLTVITDNLALIYNILFFFNFIMAGYAMYLLAKYLVKDRVTAFLVGFAYTFSPQHMSRGMHLNLLSFLWTPLFFLFFFKIFEEKKLRNAIFAAIFLFFLTLSCWPYVFFTLLISVSYFVYKFITARHLFTKHFFLRTIVFLSLFCVIAWPFVFPVISAYFGEEEYVSSSLQDESRLSFLHYILPNPWHPLWGVSVQSLESKIMPGAGFPILASLGYIIIFISLLYLIKAKKHLFWLLLAVFFILLSVNFQGLVASLLESVPLVRFMGQVRRFAFGALFSFLLFFAFALSYFLSRWKETLCRRFSFSANWVQVALVFLIFAILTIENLMIPYPTTFLHERAIRVIDSAQPIGRAVKGPHPVLNDDFSVLSFPPRCIAAPDHYFQVFHGKPIFGAHFSRRKLIEMQTIDKVEEIFLVYNINKLQQFIEEYRVGYIILYDEFMIEAYDLMDGKGSREIFLSSLSLLQDIPGRFIVKTRGFYVYEVLLEK